MSETCCKVGDQAASSRLVTRRSLFARLSTLWAALPVASVLCARGFAASTDAATKSGFYKIVNYEVPPEHWQEFLEAAKVNAEASKKDRGVTGFSLLLPRDAANAMVALESYEDEGASAAHQHTAHFHTFVDVAQGLGVKRTVVEATRYFPA